MPKANRRAPLPEEAGLLRQCRSCGGHKTPEEFDNAGKTSSGKVRRRHICLACRNRYRRERITAFRSSIEEYASVLMYRVKDRARSRPYGPPTIDEGWIVQQWDKQGGLCFYSGEAMELLSGPRLVTVERLDVRAGYTDDNCVLACFCVNMMRGSVPIEEFVWWCDRISANCPDKKEPEKTS